MNATAEFPVLGIMSGTSIDSVDYALCGLAGDRVRLVRHWQARFPPALRNRLHAAARGSASSHELGQLHHDLGRFYARAARPPRGTPAPRLVGLHGQTVYHRPHRQAPATLQIGEPAWLAEELRVPVISNFRAGDIAAGGQGAPLATLFHLAVFGQRGRHVCVHNLGGISNVTSIDWRRGTRPRVLAFDTGPANVLIDLAMRHFSSGRKSMDRDGAWAARGRVCEPLLRQWLRDPFFRQPPPKSTGRERFGEPFWQRAQAESQAAGLNQFDVIATLTEFTARSVGANYRAHLPGPPARVILAGGGAANPMLVSALRRSLAAICPKCEVLRAEDCGWGLQSIEPAAFALLAYRRHVGLPGNLPETTGARRAVLLGQVTIM